jgi:signal recognition particle receptor subunit beta
MEQFNQINDLIISLGVPAQFAVYVNIFILIVILYITYTFLFSSSSSKSQGGKGDTILIIGACGSGKTCLIHGLTGGLFPKTVTSIEPFEWNNKNGDIEYLPNTIRIVDYPGYPRLRNGINQYLENAKAIIFVVDSRNISDEAIQSSGELLAHILTRPAFVEQDIPILIACNKTDMHGAKSDAFIFSRLEKELDKLKDTRSVLMETEGGDGAEGSNEIMLGTEERFDFSVDVASGVTSCSCSCKKRDFDTVQDFLQNLF